MTASSCIVLAAGGTGGHVFPAEALANELLARGHRLALITDKRGADYGGTLGRIDRHLIRAGTLSARGVGGKMNGFLNIVAGVIQARALLPRLRPQAVVGFGGYPSLPTMLAAARLGTSVTMHEQNAVLGRVNRLMAGRAAGIALSFARTEKLAERDRPRASVTGNPVRSAILEKRETAYPVPVEEGEIRLLVTGGSQGAAIFSKVVPEAVARLDAGLRARLRIDQQCRAEDIERVRAAYLALQVKAELATFFADVPNRLAAAHLVIARSGASTVAELAAVGRPALLVPYLFATDDHQTANARALSEAGGAWTIGQREFTPENLAARLNALLSTPHYLVEAAAAARRIGQPDAAVQLADLVERVSGTNGHYSHPTDAAA